MSNVRLHRRLRIGLACVLVLCTASVARAHIRLDRSMPARDEVITVMPAELRLEFSGTIEPRYTSVSLRGPDGSVVAIGDVSLPRMRSVRRSSVRRKVFSRHSWLSTSLPSK